MYFLFTNTRRNQNKTGATFLSELLMHSCSFKRAIFVPNMLFSNLKVAKCDKNLYNVNQLTDSRHVIM